MTWLSFWQFWRFWQFLTIFDNFWQFWQFLTILDNFDNFWHLKRQSWRLDIWDTDLTIEKLNSDNHLYLTINCDTGHYLQILQCFTGDETKYPCYDISISTFLFLQIQKCWFLPEFYNSFCNLNNTLWQLLKESGAVSKVFSKIPFKSRSFPSTMKSLVFLKKRQT